jgi:hypothetical protein
MNQSWQEQTKVIVKTMAKKNLILDVDTGIDDAFALLFAARHPEINLAWALPALMEIPTSSRLLSILLKF